ncbi:SDR family oxidoreductase [Archangium violaceum]|uniref:SDR family oxidoreductase n=1 Tax=Archangium violaceum TaxID=83451 RepID=UPI00193B11A2|nr:SDR family oxidoreductase [Archangium violaceum]QRK09180.1 SDR family oxidoreductase [Archangium violaceum]
MKPLEGRIALVAGATRGAGRGIAMMLGEAGATVYCTGRSVRGRPATGTRPETIEETAELVSARGGRGIAVRVDHTVESEVAELLKRLKREQGRLDVLVNDVWGGDELTEFSQPFWKLSPEKGRLMLDRGIYSHILTSRYAVPLMLERDRGLIVEITDGDSFGYRGNLFYDLVKLSVIRLAFSMAWELRRHPITSLAVTPGFLRSEAMLEGFGVTEANWRDATAKDPHFIASETPFYVGRAVAALAADPNVAKKAGRVFSSWQLAKEYGVKDVDGRQPDWGEYFRKTFGRSYTLADEAAYATWSNGLMEIAYPDWPKE